MVKELDVYLVKEQAAFGTAETSLSNTANFFPALPDSKIEVTPEFQEIEIASGGYDQDIAVRGHVRATVGLSCYMRSIGTLVGNVPDFGLLAKAAGFAASTATGGSKYRHIFVPSTTLIGKDLTVWHYAGGVGTSASILRKVGNVVGDWKISGEAGKPGVFALVSGKGQYISDAAATLVVPTKDRSLIPAVNTVVALINNVAYKVLKFEFTGGNGVEQFVDSTTSYGMGRTDVTKKKGKFMVQVYADAALALPITALLGGDVLASTALSIRWGATADKKIDVVAAYPQYTDCKTEDAGGLTVWTLTGNLTRNDITITVNADATT
jgi:hypothetical protein